MDEVPSTGVGVEGIRVGIVSLGCPKNLVDAEVMSGLLKEEGVCLTAEPKEADIVIVNTCSFINEAKEESVETILRLARLKDEGSLKALIVSGCLPQRYKEELLPLLPEVDAFVGTGWFPRIAEVCREVLGQHRRRYWVSPETAIPTSAMPRLLTTPPHYAYVKISEGCDHRCTFCTIPATRGRHRSRPLQDILAEARRLAYEGAKELILVAQDSTAYGKDVGMRDGLAHLLGVLASVEGVEWIRVLYAYPTSVTPALIEAMATQPKVCKYLDIPLQHIHDEILTAMGRPNGTSIRRLLKRLREAIPSLTIRTTFIVGFPGETEAHFRALLDFVEEERFDRVGAFCYSEEEGTPASRMKPRVPKGVKEERRARLMETQLKIADEKGQRLVGSLQRILVDGPSLERPGSFEGRTQAHAPEVDGLVYINEPIQAGTFTDVRVVEAFQHDLFGEAVA